MNETTLFSHNHDSKLESKKFPYWKPFFEDGKWKFCNYKNELFLNGETEKLVEMIVPYFPKHKNYFLETLHYELFPCFVIDWIRTILYYETVNIRVRIEKELKSKFRQNQIDSKISEELDKFFETFS